MVVVHVRVKLASQKKKPKDLGFNPQNNKVKVGMTSFFP